MNISTKPNHIKCSDCNKKAVYIINGYRPIYLCEEHGSKAIADGYKPDIMSED